MNPEDKSAAGDQDDVAEAPFNSSPAGGTDHPDGHGPFAPPEEGASLDYFSDSPSDPNADATAGRWPGAPGSDPLHPYPADQDASAYREPGYRDQPGALEAEGAASAGLPAGEVWDDGYAAEDAESETRTDGPGTGPNWMMAFVCLWAAGTSLYEAWLVGAPAGFRRAVLMTPEFGGYALLGLGLLGFACESLIWNRGRRRGLLRYGGGHLVLILAGLGLVLAGAALLFLSRDPGRRI